LRTSKGLATFRELEFEVQDLGLLEFCIYLFMVNNPWICRAENYNTSAIELLRRLPGVTDANYRSLMDECKSLAEVALLPAERLAEVMGGKQPARMLRDFLDAKCPILA
jgi:hypothetical protein